VYDTGLGSCLSALEIIVARSAKSDGHPERPESYDDSLESIMASARAQFLRYGFDGTDVNRIARNCSLGPPSFYRWFKNKSDVFVAVYLRWEAEEQQTFRRLLSSGKLAYDLVESFASVYSNDTLLRRSLRHLACADERVRSAVSASRIERINIIQQLSNVGHCGPGDVALELLLFESLATILAEGDLRDMGRDDEAARNLLSSIVDRWRGQSND
jgi:AcrR family transcriptional regulator